MNTQAPGIQNVTVSTTALSAVLNFAASKDTRYYLNGVAVQLNNGAVRIAATDGSVLGVMKSGLVFDTDAGEGELIIPADVVKDIVKKAGKAACVSLVRLPGDSMPARYEVIGLGLYFAPIDGKFPDWRRVLPSSLSADGPGQFNPELLTKFGKAAKVLGDRLGHLHIAHNGAGAAVVSLPCCADFVGVVMPIRAPSEWSAVSVSSLSASFK